MQNSTDASLPFPISLVKLSADEKKSCHFIIEKTSGVVARHFNKRFSLPLSIYLARWNILPNWITLFNLLLGIYAGFLASVGSPSAIFKAGLLFQIVSILDGCDGEVAKINQKSSRWGAWFDTFGDNFSLICFIMGIAWGYYHVSQALWVWHLTIFNLGILSLMFFIMFRYLLKQKNSHPSLVNYDKEVVSKSPLPSKMKSFIASAKYLVKKDVFTLIFCFLCFLNLPQVLLVLFTIGILGITVTLLMIQHRSNTALDLPSTNNEALS